MGAIGFDGKGKVVAACRAPLPRKSGGTQYPPTRNTLSPHKQASVSDADPCYVSLTSPSRAVPDVRPVAQGLKPYGALDG